MTATTTVTGLTRKKRFRSAGPLHPEHWEVSTEWKHGRTTLAARRHDFQVQGERRWFMFERLVHNTQTDTWWIDGFEMYPYGGFVAFRPEKVTKVRAHVEPKRDRRDVPAGEGSDSDIPGPA